jgi:hypothetical protein
MTAPRDDAANAMRDTVMATVSSSVTFALSAIATQRIGLIFNVGCYGGALGGALSAACASASAAASGHAARETVNLYSDDKSRRGKRRSKSRRRSSWNAAMGVDEDEVARDVGVGLATFMALSRGNLGRILPSDVSRVGANAYKSIAARGSDYASEGQKKTLQKWFKKFGCHHCGSSKGKVIGDHMPPNKTAFGSGARAAANRGASTTRRVFNFIRGVPLQRFYPQCESCSALQSIAVRTGATKLVSHAVGVRYAVFAGAAVGVSTLHFGTIKTWVDDKVKRINGVVRA